MSDPFRGDGLPDAPNEVFDSGRGRRDGALRPGRTHYPHVVDANSIVVGDRVTLVSSTDETAKDVYRAPPDRGPARAGPVPRPRRRSRL
ncbi:hypothetical protein [Actinomadura sp. 9N215]|uniref:hypothetical protein n=1 Tax=Actinomadura sp. 9N215 TaxID=3375150 RepID=UPI00379D9E9E